MQSVYIDLYFMINVSMDFLCFFLTSRLLSRRVSLPRSLFGALFGGIYACVSLFLPLGGIWGFFADMAACVLMCIIAVKKKGEIRQTGEYILVYTAVSILLGGFMTVLFSFFNKIGLDRLLGEKSGSDEMPVWLFSVLALLGALMSLFGSKIMRRRGTRRYGEVEITVDGKTLKLSALCDSGNMLREPISSKECIVADKETLREIIPEELFSIIDGSGELTASPRLRPIAVCDASGEKLMYALRADRVRVNMGNGYFEADTFVVPGEVKGRDFCALIPPELAVGAP